MRVRHCSISRSPRIEGASPRPILDDKGDRIGIGRIGTDRVAVGSLPPLRTRGGGRRQNRWTVGGARRNETGIERRDPAEIGLYGRQPPAGAAGLLVVPISSRESSEGRSAAAKPTRINAGPRDARQGIEDRPQYGAQQFDDERGLLLERPAITRRISAKVAVTVSSEVGSRGCRCAAHNSASRRQRRVSNRRLRLQPRRSSRPAPAG